MSKSTNKKPKSGYLTCVITGKKHYVYGPSFEKKIAKFGSLEELAKHFISSKAKKLLKQGLSQQEVRDKLKIKTKLPEVDDIILIRNKIKKVNKREKKNDNSDYLQSAEFLLKKQKELATRNTYESFKAYVEYFTGGPNRCQVENGGTCQQPQVWYSNDEYCDGCTWYQYCLVSSKRLSKKTKNQ